MHQIQGGSKKQTCLLPPGYYHLLKNEIGETFFGVTLEPIQAILGVTLGHFNTTFFEKLTFLLRWQKRLYYYTIVCNVLFIKNSFDSFYIRNGSQQSFSVLGNAEVDSLMSQLPLPLSSQISTAPGLSAITRLFERLKLTL